MRIPCPFFGERSSAEFAYLGDADPTRPDPKTAATDFYDYVYTRANPPGPIREWWQHAGGCRAFIRVERDVTTHAIGAVAPAPGLAGRT